MTCGNPAGDNEEQSKIDGIGMERREKCLKIFQD